MKGFWGKVGDYAWMAAGVHAYLRRPAVQDGAERIRRQAEDREEKWLSLVGRTIFSAPEHPYRRLFEAANCNFDDLAAAVRTDGFEPTLANLRRAGVYLSNDEFKGRTPIRRGALTIDVRTADFLNPLATGSFRTSSGGSRSQGTRTPLSAEFKAYIDYYDQAVIREFGLRDSFSAEVKPLLPGTAGIVNVLRSGRNKTPVDRWFSFGGPARDSAHYRALTNSLIAVGRLHGVRAPFPEHLEPNDFLPAARAVAEARAAGRARYVGAFASAGARMALAARESGLDISGTTLALSAEAVTEQKLEAALAAGCLPVNRYWVSEIGPIGFGCRRLAGRGVHLFRDAHAVITHRRAAPFSDAEVDALQFTTLLPFAPYVLVNCEMDDSARLEPVECECEFQRLGNTHALYDISSFGKLTGHGMTLAGADVVGLLEGRLPALFGGGPGDYQLVQRQGERQTELLLRASPRLTDIDAERLRAYFLAEVRALYGGAEASRVWRHAEAVRVVRETPAMTSRGKILPLHLENKETAHAT